MCNCSTALYITTIPLIFSVISFLIAVVFVHIKEVADNRRRQIQTQSEMLVRGIMNFCCNVGIIAKDSIYHTALERYAKQHNKRRSTVDFDKKALGEK